jgi:hypothetical protein
MIPVGRGTVAIGAESYGYELQGSVYVLRGHRRVLRAVAAVATGDGSYRLHHVSGPPLRNHALRTLRVRAGRLEVVS